MGFIDDKRQGRFRQQPGLTRGDKACRRTACCQKPLIPELIEKGELAGERLAERRRAPYDLRQVCAFRDRRTSTSNDIGEGGWNGGRKENWLAQQRPPRLTCRIRE